MTAAAPDAGKPQARGLSLSQTVLAAAALIGLMVDINRQVSSQQAEQSKDVVISVNFTVWFYLSVLAFLAAAYFFFYWMRQSTK